MAEVYAATDERLGRRVAVKLLHTNLATESEFRNRFRREAQAAARMTHTTIVRVFDAGEDTFVRNDGFEVVVPYIVMEYIDGVQLSDLITTPPLPNEKIAKYMEGLLTSLEYSHRAGVVHRDIKPGNVMITTDDQVKVTDFGIARAISDTAGTIAQTTAILGTASYFSPEQARGETVDGRSDLYSAGIVLYEMLTGRVPFQGDSAVAVAYQHVTEPPVKPSQVNPQVSPALEAVVLKSLAKRREDRYQTAAEFRQELLAAFDGVMPAYTAEQVEQQPTELFGPGPTAVDATESALNSMNTDDDRAPEVQRRPPAMWIWGAAAMVAAVVIGVVIWVASISGQSPLPEASVQVPDVVGLSKTEAVEKIEEANLVPKVETAPSDDVEVDHVISTNPPAESSVAFESTVKITVSAGPDSVKVPNLNGLTVEEATAALEEAGLKVGAITSEDSPYVPENGVVRSDPGIGRPAAPGTAVDLWVSNGQVTIPDTVVGASYEDAFDVLAALGLQVISVEDDTCPKVNGRTITKVSPGPGKVPQGSRVEVTYCTGSDTPPTQTQAPDPTQEQEPPRPTAGGELPPPPGGDGGNGGPGNNSGNGNPNPGG